MRTDAIGRFWMDKKDDQSPMDKESRETLGIFSDMVDNATSCPVDGKGTARPEPELPPPGGKEK